MDGTLVPAKQPTAMQRENDLIKTIKQLTCSDKYVKISRRKALCIIAPCFCRSHGASVLRLARIDTTCRQRLFPAAVMTS